MYVCVCVYIYIYIHTHIHLQKREQAAVTITFEVLRTCFDMPLHAAATKLVSHMYSHTYVCMYVHAYNIATKLVGDMSVCKRV
jgi:hypothetical protein